MVSKQKGMVKLQENTKKSLEQEIQIYRDEASKQRKIIYQLEKDRDQYINEASELTQKVVFHMEEFKKQELKCFEYRCCSEDVLRENKVWPSLLAEVAVNAS